MKLYLFLLGIQLVEPNCFRKFPKLITNTNSPQDFRIERQGMAFCRNYSNCGTPGILRGTHKDYAGSSENTLRNKGMQGTAEKQANLNSIILYRLLSSNVGFK